MSKKLFKLVIRKADRVIFESLVEATAQKQARARIQSLLRTQSLTGIVYSFGEVPISSVQKIISEALACVKSAGLDISKLLAQDVESTLSRKLCNIKQRLAALEKRLSKEYHAVPELGVRASVNWRDVKKFYERTRSPKRTALRFGLSVNTVKAQVRRNGWSS